MFLKRKFTCTEIAIPTRRLELCTTRNLLRHYDRRDTQEATEELTFVRLIVLYWNTKSPFVIVLKYKSKPSQDNSMEVVLRDICLFT